VRVLRTQIELAFLEPVHQDLLGFLNLLVDILLLLAALVLVIPFLFELPTKLDSLDQNLFLPFEQDDLWVGFARRHPRLLLNRMRLYPQTF